MWHPGLFLLKNIKRWLVVFVKHSLNCLFMILQGARRSVGRKEMKLMPMMLATSTTLHLAMMTRSRRLLTGCAAGAWTLGAAGMLAAPSMTVARSGLPSMTVVRSLGDTSRQSLTARFVPLLLWHCGKISLDMQWRLFSELICRSREKSLVLPLTIIWCPQLGTLASVLHFPMWIIHVCLFLAMLSHIWDCTCLIWRSNDCFLLHDSKSVKGILW